MDNLLRKVIYFCKIGKIDLRDDIVYVIRYIGAVFSFIFFLFLYEFEIGKISIFFYFRAKIYASALKLSIDGFQRKKKVSCRLHNCLLWFVVIFFRFVCIFVANWSYTSHWNFYTIVCIYKIKAHCWKGM